MDLFTFQIDMHLLLLAISLILLIFGLTVKDGYSHLVALCILVMESGRYLVMCGGDRANLCTEWALVGGTGLICLLVSSPWTRIFLGCIGIAILASWNNWQQNDSGDLGGDNVDESMELLIGFHHKKDLLEWVSQNEDRYDLSYPIFAPEDKSLLLDEYVGVNVANMLEAHKLKAKCEKNITITNVEYNDRVTNGQLPSERSMAKSGLLNDEKLDEQWVSGSFDLKGYHNVLARRKAKMAASSTTTIAILDTGVDAQHEDLQDNYVSTRTRYDKDSKGHGTHCAGVAAAVSGNKIGIASLLPPESNVKVTGIKVLSNFGVGSQKAVIAGIIEAADEGYSVISLSLGGRSNDERQKAYTEAVRYANKKGAIVIAAAGNSASDARDHSPANTPGIITVAAVDVTKQKTSFSNSVESLSMGIGAPGKDILSTFPGDEYKSFSGTSMATPFIAGLIGLFKDIKPDMTTKEAYHLLKSTSDMEGGLPVVHPTRAVKELLTK